MSPKQKLTDETYDFSVGQRLALLEEKIVLAHVLRHFRVQATQPFEEIQVCPELVLRPRDGIFVTLEERT